MVALITVALVGPPNRTITKPIAMKVVFQTVSPPRGAIERRRQSCSVAPAIRTAECPGAEAVFGDEQAGAV